MKQGLAFLILVALAISIVACAKEAPPTTPPPLPGDGEDIVPAGPVKELTMTAFQFGFDPSTVTVKKGDVVRIKVTSTDVVHSLVIPEFGIDERLPPSEERVVEFVADKEGAFEFHCGVYCGEGHDEHVGKLVVEE